MDNENNKQVIKDMSDDYNNKLSVLLSEIDYCESILPFSVLYPETNVPILVILNNRLHKLFKTLIGKMTTEEKIKQFHYDSLLNKIQSHQIITFGKKESTEGDIESYVKKSNYYISYYKTIESRQIHINSVMERMGLTSKEKEKPIRLM